MLLATTIPTRARINTDEFLNRSRKILDHLDRAGERGESVLADEERQASLQALVTATKRVETPLRRVEHALHPWVVFAIIPLFALANAGVSLGEGTEFGERSGWEWMQLLIIPVVISVAGLWFNWAQDARQREDAQTRAEAQLEAEEERTQQEALQQYNNEMRSLLLEEDLLDSQGGDAVRELARARTLGVLDILDPDRKRIVVLFLRETSLISSSMLTPSLTSVELT